MLVLFAVAIKLLFFFFFASQKNPEAFVQNTFYSIFGDARGYIEPVENLINKGEHRTNGGNYTFRTPGYSPVLLFFRSFFDLKWALNSTLILQAILSGISCYILALLSFNLFSSKKLFYFVFIGYTFSTYVSIWDSYILTESFATSTLIFSCFFFERSIRTNSKLQILFSGIFITWSIFLRPFVVPVLVLLLFALVAHFYKRKSFKKLGQFVIIFIIPFVLIDSLWIYRNYRISDEFVPLQSRITYNDGELLNEDLDVKLIIADFVRPFGGDHTFWNPKGAAYWFFNDDTYTATDPFPDQLFNSTLTLDTLKKVKSLCIQIESGSFSHEETTSQKHYISTTVKKFYKTYRSDHPFHFFVTSKFIHLKNFILHSGVYNIPFPAFADQNIFQKFFKLFYSFIYLGVSIIGLFSSFYLVISNIKTNQFRSVLFSIPLYFLFLFPIVLMIHEYRFNTLSYPFLLIATCYFIVSVLEWFKNKRTATR